MATLPSLHHRHEHCCCHETAYGSSYIPQSHHHQTLSTHQRFAVVDGEATIGASRRHRHVVESHRGKLDHGEAANHCTWFGGELGEWRGSGGRRRRLLWGIGAAGAPLCEMIVWCWCRYYGAASWPVALSVSVCMVIVVDIVWLWYKFYNIRMLWWLLPAIFAKSFSPQYRHTSTSSDYVEQYQNPTSSYGESLRS